MATMNTADLATLALMAQAARTFPDVYSCDVLDNDAMISEYAGDVGYATGYATGGQSESGDTYYDSVSLYVADADNVHTVEFSRCTLDQALSALFAMVKVVG